jgi:formamidopyrimidine-DNA glycosylase
MPELPDVQVLVDSMNKVLPGLRIEKVPEARDVCVNMPLTKFKSAVTGKTIKRAWRRGKWAVIDLDEPAKMAISLGMGGEVRYDDDIPQMSGKLAFVFELDNGYVMPITFWWFGNVFAYPKGDLASCPRLGKLGPDALSEDVTLGAFREMLAGARGRVKPYLLDQKKIAGIGNVYIQDMLYHAGIHPMRQIPSLSEEEVKKLYRAMVNELEKGIRYGGGPGESDILGNKGTYWDHTKIAYRKGKNCPRCQTVIEEIRVSNTASFICPKCQPL